MVSEMSFLECQLDSNAIEFLVCDGKASKNNRNNKIKKITFQNNQIDKNLFKPGHSYFFICNFF